MSEDERPEVQVGPVTKVARDLTEILALYDDLREQAVTKSDSNLMPGGAAMAALGNVANMEAWENQQQATERYGRAYTSVEDEDPDDAWSAFQLLEFWSEQWRQIHGAEYDVRPTIATEAAFIRWALNWAWDNEVHFADFATDVRRARLKLENILNAGTRAERVRVVCNQCEAKPRLILLFGERLEDDCHKCPGCKHRFNEREFKDAHAAMLRSEGADKHVKAKEAIATLVSQGRGERTVKRWLAPQREHIADRCTVCRRRWEPQEFAACPGIRDDEECGGDLIPVWKGNAEDVVEGWCDLRTHEVWLYWPDLWRKHLATRRTPRSGVA